MSADSAICTSDSKISQRKIGVYYHTSIRKKKFARMHREGKKSFCRIIKNTSGFGLSLAHMQTCRDGTSRETRHPTTRQQLEKCGREP